MPDRFTAILDIDGTLADTNYHHAVAWYRAFQQANITIPIWKLHRHVGMGGDNFVKAVAGETVESEQGDDIRAGHDTLYMAMIQEISLLPGAKELIAELKQRGQAVVLASSARAEEVEHYLDLLDARETVDGWTTAGDVESTKPAPDLLEAALKKVDGQPDNAALVGDTVWDAKAANAAGVTMIGLLTGGFSAAELNGEGVESVFEHAEELLNRIDETSLAERA